jgi:hypothetical protein
MIILYPKLNAIKFLNKKLVFPLQKNQICQYKNSMLQYIDEASKNQEKSFFLVAVENAQYSNSLVFVKKGRFIGKKQDDESSIYLAI